MIMKQKIAVLRPHTLLITSNNTKVINLNKDKCKNITKVKKSLESKLSESEICTENHHGEDSEKRTIQRVFHNINSILKAFTDIIIRN